MYVELLKVKQHNTRLKLYCLYFQLFVLLNACSRLNFNWNNKIMSYFPFDHAKFEGA